MIVAIIQARMSSSRLPGKVMREIVGQPMLALQLQRIQQAKNLDKIVIATSQEASDDVIEAFCQQHEVACFRGSLNDVLQRYCDAALQAQADYVVRLTADCPLIDPSVIDKVVKHLLDNKLDYASNTLTPTYPDGLDVEAFSMQALQQAREQARLPSEREHVTPYITHHPELFKLGDVQGERNLNHLRWTVDENRDFLLVQKIYEALYPKFKAHFTTEDILQLYAQQPELETINQDIIRNEGYLKSLQEDEAYLNKETQRDI